MRVRWTKKADKNLEDIEEFIAQDNTVAALHTVFRIAQAVSILSQHPNMGRRGRVANTRELIIAGTPYIVPYRIKTNTIEILRVLHSSMQWPEAL